MRSGWLGFGLTGAEWVLWRDALTETELLGYPLSFRGTDRRPRVESTGLEFLCSRLGLTFMLGVGAGFTCSRAGGKEYRMEGSKLSLVGFEARICKHRYSCTLLFRSVAAMAIGDALESGLTVSPAVLRRQCSMSLVP